MKITDYIFNSSSNPVVYGFTGREFDLESKTYYYRNRQYNPDNGKFLSQDPIGFAAGDENLYKYVFNKPLANTDPEGKFLPVIFGALAGATVAYIQSDGDFQSTVVGATVGAGLGLFLTAATASTGISAGVKAIAASGFSGGLSSVANSSFNDKEIRTRDVVTGAAIGFASGFAGILGAELAGTTAGILSAFGVDTFFGAAAALENKRKEKDDGYGICKVQ